MKHYIDLTTEQLKELHGYMRSNPSDNTNVLKVLEKLEVHLKVPGLEV